MRVKKRWLFCLAVCVAASCTTAPHEPADAPRSAATTSAPAPVPTCVALQRDTHEQLQSVLWMQTSAEYRALSESTYRAAGGALVRALGDPAWTATEQTDDFAKRSPAVILDLDETVLDNSRFQAELARRRTAYSPDLWKEWVRMRRAGLVPGAGEFLQMARDRKVAVFFVTNRKIEEESDTLANLLALQVQATADEILSAGEIDPANKEGWPSDKTSRRQAIARDHRILLLVGDDLGDFLSAKLTPEDRVRAAEKYGAWWGNRWFLLANPSYGSWDRALYDHNTQLPDRDVLLRKFAHLKGMYN